MRPKMEVAADSRTAARRPASARHCRSHSPSQTPASTHRARACSQQHEQREAWRERGTEAMPHLPSSANLRCGSAPSAAHSLRGEKSTVKAAIRRRNGMVSKSGVGIGAPQRLHTPAPHCTRRRHPNGCALWPAHLTARPPRRICCAPPPPKSPCALPRPQTAAAAPCG